MLWECFEGFVALAFAVLLLCVRWLWCVVLTMSLQSGIPLIVSTTVCRPTSFPKQRRHTDRLDDLLDLRQFLDRFYMSRIGIRLLMQVPEPDTACVHSPHL